MDINKIKDKKARQYLLRMVRGWKATKQPLKEEATTN